MWTVLPELHHMGKYDVGVGGSVAVADLSSVLGLAALLCLRIH